MAIDISSPDLQRPPSPPLQERTYKRFYGLLAQRFCYISTAYMVGGAFRLSWGM